MKPRRISRSRRERAFARALQRWRLEQIACGAEKPLCDREEFYLQTLQDFGRANPADFIVPYPVLLLEALELPPPGDPRRDSLTRPPPKPTASPPPTAEERRHAR